MSQENVEVVCRTGNNFNAFMRGELLSEAYAEPFAPQIELRTGMTSERTPRGGAASLGHRGAAS